MLRNNEFVTQPKANRSYKTVTNHTIGYDGLHHPLKPFDAPSPCIVEHGKGAVRYRAKMYVGNKILTLIGLNN